MRRPRCTSRNSKVSAGNMLTSLMPKRPGLPSLAHRPDCWTSYLEEHDVCADSTPGDTSSHRPSNDRVRRGGSARGVDARHGARTIREAREEGGGQGVA